MQVFSLPLAQLKEDPRNARKHNRRNLDRIKASLERFGQQTPIVIDADDVVRKGNGTFRAAGELGWPEINCVRTDLVGSAATAYALADNKTSDDAEYDELILVETMRSLQSEEDATLAMATGFADDEVDALAEKLASQLLDEPTVLADLPELGKSSTHQVTISYTDDDEPALRQFVQQEDDGPLSPAIGKLILGRIKDLAAD